MASTKQLREAHASAAFDFRSIEPRGTRASFKVANQRRYSLAICNSLCVAALAGVLVSTGCTGPGRLKAVPVALQDRATVPGFPRHIRTWGDRLSPEFVAECVAAAKCEEDSLGKQQVKSDRRRQASSGLL